MKPASEMSWSMRGGRGKRATECGEIGVGGGLAGDEAAERGEDVVEVEVVEGADEAFGLVALEDADLAAGAEDCGGVR